jgi:hypothetical protein
MRLNDPAIVAEVAAAFQRHEKALDDNDAAARVVSSCPGLRLHAQPVSNRPGLARARPG